MSEPDEPVARRLVPMSSTSGLQSASEIERSTLQLRAASRPGAPTAHWWPPESRAMWFAVFGAPLAWGVQLGVSWLVVNGACRARALHPGQGLSLGAIRAIEVGIDCLLMVVALAALAIGLKAFRSSGDRRITSVHAFDRPAFFAAIAVLVSAVFWLAMAYSTLPNLMLPLCESTR